MIVSRRRFARTTAAASRSTSAPRASAVNSDVGNPERQRQAMGQGYVPHRGSRAEGAARLLEGRSRGEAEQVYDRGNRRSGQRADGARRRQQLMTIRLRVISLGAGVQSTTMALMAAHGEITPMPDCAIFADTQSEPQAVYDHLKWLMSPNVLPFPIHVVTKGSLRAAILSASAGRTRNDGRPPLYIRNPDGTKGILKRQCTADYN